eukprot:8781338-Ditylum_brightwellii.AAC.1
MTDEQTKKLIFDQHPEKWRIAYNCSGQAIETDTLADIVQFMSDEKGYADKEEKNYRGKHGNEYNKGREKNIKGWFNKNNDKTITMSGMCTEEYQALHLAQSMARTTHW